MKRASYLLLALAVFAIPMGAANAASASGKSTKHHVKNFDRASSHMVYSKMPKKQPATPPK